MQMWQASVHRLQAAILSVHGCNSMSYHNGLYLALHRTAGKPCELSSILHVNLYRSCSSKKVKGFCPVGLTPIDPRNEGDGSPQSCQCMCCSSSVHSMGDAETSQSTTEKSGDGTTIV